LSLDGNGKEILDFSVTRVSPQRPETPPAQTNRT
jgi:hypothetical protein